MAFGGGVDGVGVTSGIPRVYLVFYGSQWAQGGGGDPNGVSTFLQALFTGIGTGGEKWSGTMTQYCDGPGVAKGAKRCDPSSMPHVGYPSQGALAGVWFDTAAPSPPNATAEFPAGGWTNPVSGDEVGDTCAWIATGQGHAANVSLSTGKFAMQSTWSNDTDTCEISHAIR